MVATSPGEIRAVAIDDHGPLDYAIERPGQPDGVGDRHRGRITAHLPALAGSFVLLADGTEGFLPDSAGGNQPQGTILPVRITRAAQAGKGPRLAADTASPGPVALLARGPGAVARLAALHPDAPIELDDPALAATLRPTLEPRLHRVPRAIDESLESILDSLAEPAADLPGGIRMTIHPTPALTAIDLDLAAASATRATKSRTHDSANRAALPALARQLRLRNLSGAIVIDLAGLSPKRRAALGPAFTAALATDPLSPRFLGFSALGLAEILRPRIHPPLHELLAPPHATGLAALRHAARQSAATPGTALALHAAPPVIAALNADPMALAAFKSRAGHPISLRADPALAPRSWRIEEIPHA
ncbi:MAG: ribonuclease E/G [Acetobacteraceae bacterium]|nr:ribonuclease E/G [Acetobacteraceae bacterium]